jgi:glycosyltransferase involved in cell wall biosynthesis
MTSPIGWQVRQIELQEIPDLETVSPYRGIYAVFWWGATPLGHCKIAAADLPLSAAQLRYRASIAIAPALAAYSAPEHLRAPLPHAPKTLYPAHALETITAIQQPFNALPPPPSNSNSISVVICTRDRPDQLAQCLRSLQALPQAPHEIIVVDNASKTDATRQRVAQIPGVKYVSEPRPGLDIARNTGIRCSSSDIIAFTDDDVQIHPNWLIGIQRAFEQADVQAVTGLVLPMELETEAQEIFETYWSFNRGYRVLEFNSDYFQQLRAYGVPSWCVGAGANMAFRRQIFQQVGEFDERLDVGAAGCSGDSEMWYRILAAGGICRYEPTAVVFHQHRREMESFKEQIFSYMRGHVTALLIQFEKTGHGGNLRRLFGTLPYFYLKLLIKRGLGDNRPRQYTLFREIRGCISGLFFYGSI